ncbi:MAG: methyltransferase [Deltaproteobacteria bacterium]|nr:methyltransferase [Deltaproteobacteria bacterium]
MARGSDFDLAAALARPGFTPGRGDVPALLDLIAGGADPAAQRAAAALATLGDLGLQAVLARLAPVEGAPLGEEGARARLVGAAGILARRVGPVGEAAVARLVAWTADPQVRVRRAAIAALGKVGGDAARAALIARWDAGDAPPDERRTLAEALGKVGGAEALARLRSTDTGDDAELARRRDRAVLMADREAHRAEPSEVAADAAPPASIAPPVVRLGCKAGLAPLLYEELRGLGLAGPPPRRDDHVDVTLRGPWSTLFASRLWATAAIQLGALDVARGAEPEVLGAAIVRLVTAEPTRALLRAWTRGPIRWRLGFARGHKRAIVWRVARDVAAAAPELVNDPTATTWEILVDDEAGTAELVPRRLADPRTAWRSADVPAASHPSVAAALAYLATPREGDRVWDPFCGSGLELAECWLRGARSLAGSDLDDAALAAARTNLDAAGATVARLAAGDARAYAPADLLGGAPTLIITNPPLGSRVAVAAPALLAEAMHNFGRRLAPGGRLVWITPAPKRTSPAAEAIGLCLVRAFPVDLGGVRGRLERWDHPAK